LRVIGARAASQLGEYLASQVLGFGGPVWDDGPGFTFLDEADTTGSRTAAKVAIRESPLPGHLSDPPGKAWAGTFVVDVPPMAAAAREGVLAFFLPWLEALPRGGPAWASVFPIARHDLPRLTLPLFHLFETLGPLALEKLGE